MKWRRGGEERHRYTVLDSLLWNSSEWRNNKANQPAVLKPRSPDDVAECSLVERQDPRIIRSGNLQLLRLSRVVWWWQRMRHRLLNEMFSRLVLRLLYYELLSFVSPDRETAEPFAYRKLSAGYSAVTIPSHRLLPTCVVVVSKFCQDLFQKVVSIFCQSVHKEVYLGILPGNSF